MDRRQSTWSIPLGDMTLATEHEHPVTLHQLADRLEVAAKFLRLRAREEPERLRNGETREMEFDLSQGSGKEITATHEQAEALKQPYSAVLTQPFMSGAILGVWAPQAHRKSTDPYAKAPQPQQLDYVREMMTPAMRARVDAMLESAPAPTKAPPPLDKIPACPRCALASYEQVKASGVKAEDLIGWYHATNFTGIVKPCEACKVLHGVE